MLYAIGEILVFLIIAALLGAILGWLLKDMLLRKQLETTWRRECDKHRKQAEQLQTQLNECTRQRDRLETEPVAPTEEPSHTEAADKRESEAVVLDKASAQEQVKTIAARTARDQQVEDDDLIQIRGIGPVLEKLLKSMGITSFRQIANFTEEDVKIIATALGSFPGRIERDNWKQSARELHQKKYDQAP